MYPRVSADVYDDAVATIDTSVVAAMNMYWSAVVLVALTKSLGASECIFVVTMIC